MLRRMPRHFALIATLAALAACTQPMSRPPAAAPEPAVLAPRPVTARAETAPVESGGDAADDAAIWVHPQNPAQSLIVGTDKRRGLLLYDLEGRQLQSLPDGRMNNVDLRAGFALGGRDTVLVAATNRSSRTISFYRLDPEARRLERLGPDLPTGFDDPYGICLYRARSGALYVFANEAGSGHVRQWRLQGEGGSIAAELVRQFAVGSQAEGCAADDDAGDLYVAEEDVGLWKYRADPDGGSRRTLIDRVGGQHGLTPDLEGVAIWQGRNGRGWVVVSNQGAGNYAVYRREGHNEFVGLFAIVSDPARGVDGTSDTDGVDLTSQPLGPAYPDGLLVAQDGDNEPAGEHQNFKLVSWREVAAALGVAEGD
jgi:3-phytase